MRSRKILIHVLCWVLFITYEVSMARYMNDPSPLIAFACFYILDIALFYFNAHVIFDSFFRDRSAKRFMILVISILGEIAIYSYLSVILNNAFKIFSGKTDIHLFFDIKADVVASAVWRSIYFIGFSIAYRLALQTVRAIRATTEARINALSILNKNQQLEKDNLILKNAYLQTRINPHFLFNTLNFIYNQAEEHNPNLSVNIVLLSEIMQYALSAEDNDGKVPLCKEVEHIKRYIKLNMSRFDNRLFLNAKIDHILDKEVRIPPLILLTFIENLFKHGDMTDKDAPGIIMISYCNGIIDVLTKNKKRNARKDLREHVGIQNALTRLNNFYPKTSIDYSINDDAKNYTFTLKLSL